MPTIVDVIQETSPGYNLTRTFVVIDRPFDFRYVCKGRFFVAEDDGFFSCLERTLSPHEEIVNKKLAVPMLDGTILEAHVLNLGGSHPRASELTTVGVASVEELRDRYKFAEVSILTSKLQEWLAENEPSTDHQKYKERAKGSG